MKVEKLQKARNRKHAIWGIQFKPQKYVQTDRKGNPIRTSDGRMTIIDLKRKITRMATANETQKLQEDLKP